MRQFPQMLHIGVAVRILRKFRKLTVAQLAEAAKLDPKTVVAVENHGESSHSTRTLGEIAKVLGFTSTDALRKEMNEWCTQWLNAPPRIKRDAQELIELWTKLEGKPEQRKFVLAAARLSVKDVQSREQSQQVFVAHRAADQDVLADDVRVRSRNQKAPADRDRRSGRRRLKAGVDERSDSRQYDGRRERRTTSARLLESEAPGIQTQRRRRDDDVTSGEEARQ